LFSYTRKFQIWTRNGGGDKAGTGIFRGGEWWRGRGRDVDLSAETDLPRGLEAFHLATK